MPDMPLLTAIIQSGSFGLLAYCLLYTTIRTVPAFLRGLTDAMNAQRDAHAAETAQARLDCHARISELRADVQSLIKDLDKS